MQEKRVKKYNWGYKKVKQNLIKKFKILKINLGK